MTVARLVREVHRHGVRLYRHGSAIRLVPAGRLPGALRSEIGRHREVLLEVLPRALSTVV